MRYNLYKQRTFSEKFNLAFEWVRDNWRPLLKYVTIFLLPISLLQGFGQNSMMLTTLSVLEGGSSASSSDMADMGLLGLNYLCALLGGFLSFSLFFALIKLSFIDDKDLHALTLREVWVAMTQNMSRLLLGGIVLIIIMGVMTFIGIFVCVGLAMISSFIGILLCLCAVIALLCALAIFLPFFPIYVLSSESLFEALQHSVRLGVKCWWCFVSAMIVMLLLVYVVQGFVSVPFIAYFAFKGLYFVGGGADAGVIVDFLGYLSSVLMIYVGYALSALTVVITTIQYGHATDVVDGISAEEEIDQF